MNIVSSTMSTFPYYLSFAFLITSSTEVYCNIFPTRTTEEPHKVFSP